MFGPRPVHIFICSISLAIAGCANGNTGGQETQTSAAAATPRQKTLLVNDLVFSPDMPLIDRGFAARLETKLGTPMTNDVIKSITAKRVNDEVVATIIVNLRTAGLNARLSSQEEPTPRSGTLIAAGRVHAADQGGREQRNAAGAGGVVVDVTMSEVSEGTEKQLLTFAAQAQSGREPGAASAGFNTPALNAAIGSVLAARSQPDVNLSPEVEVMARRLGRTVAEKIVAYAAQQGWVAKADLPVPTEDAKPARKQPDAVPVAAAKQDGSSDPKNTIPCEAFTKNARGNWYVKGPVTFNLGSAENKTLENMEIPPKFFTIGGVDLYEAIQKKCSGWQPSVRLR
ncbi:MAG TPA: hypothetical protein VK430_05635 [Xanthobacteraceae bacterium]|nr:hypothetical protein [Xanthobacteraceae bacterium]